MDLLDQSERRAKSLRSGKKKKNSPSRDTSVEPSTLERRPVLGRLDHHDPDRARARARSVLARRRAPSRVFPRLFPARARAGLVRARRGRGRGRRQRRRFRSTSGARACCRPFSTPTRAYTRRSASGGGNKRRLSNDNGETRAPATCTTTTSTSPERVTPDDPAASAAVAALAANDRREPERRARAVRRGRVFRGRRRGIARPCWRSRTREEEARLRNPRGDAAWFGGARAWIDPPAAAWGANVHAIDLRGVRSVRDSVQCNCAAYAERTPGTPQRRDHAPRRRGGHRVLRRRRARAASTL